MLTGTPLDLTPFGPLLSWLGAAYWLLALALAGFALWVPGRWWIKAPVAAVILAAFIYPVLMFRQDQAQKHDAAKAKLDAAKAHFEMRCKGAGEKITRTVENVDGVVWMKWREPLTAKDGYDQFKLNDPHGRDCEAEECISQLLRLEIETGRFISEVDLRKGRYRFVEAAGPSDSARYRYTGTMTLPSPPWTPEAIERQQRLDGQPVGDSSYRFTLERRAISQQSARYGITWDDISTREDREHWIAGGSLKLIDLQTNEVIAERIGYLIDTGQGSTAGFRDPWGWAKSYAPRCPRTNESTREFATKVLQPTKQ